MALVIIGLAIGFTLIDIIFGELRNSYGYYLLLIVVGGLSYACCLANKQTLGACIGLIGGNLLIFVFATDKAIMDGVLMLYIPAVLCTLVLIDGKLLILRVLLCAFSASLVVLAHYIDYPLLSYGTETALKYPITFFVDFFASLVISITVLQFVVGVNAKVESKLLDNQNELHQLSKALKKSETRLVLANKGSRIGIYEWSVMADSIYVSEEWLSLLGYHLKDLQIASSADFLALLHPDDQALMKSTIKRYAHISEPFELEVRRKTKDGTYRWFLDRGMMTVQDEQHVHDVVIGTTMDIHERKMNELQISDQFGKLQETNRELDSFVYSTSHDLRSPLNSILGLLYLAEDADSIDELRGYLKHMEKNVKILDEFIVEIGMYTQNAKQEVKTERVEVWTLLQEVLESLRYNAWYKQVQVFCDVPQETVMYTDKSRLRIIFSNLISNAIKYQDPLKENQFVRISLENKSDETHVLIEDNGIGIDNANQEKIFEMFYRAYAQVEGSGLGLYLTSEIVNKIKGKLFLCSRLEEGTTVKLIFPQKIRV
ncbi:PAS domain-containing sensor histidine kinase [Olivibacter ginsenosidimutans]|uniref:sensor histidine kinase n=1 Tax=Olivibacter ginsenosidimutans TaxID=1176537 RepID=UPI0031E6C67C